MISCGDQKSPCPFPLLHGSYESSCDTLPKCRICFASQEDEEMKGVPLISPCACQGSTVHEHCLKKWLKMRKKRQSGLPSRQCELCRANFRIKREFRPFHQWRCIDLKSWDVLLHLIFFFSIIVFVCSLTLTIHLFRNGPVRRNVYYLQGLSQHETLTLVCGIVTVMFFFLALIVELKVNDSIYKLLHRFIQLNTLEQFLDYYPAIV